MPNLAIKCELSGDRERGPGHGILTVTGLSATPGAFEFALMRNQGTEPYLGLGATWQTDEVLLSAKEAVRDGDATRVRVGPQMVDAIVALPTHVAYRLVVATDEGRVHGTLKVNHPLLGSKAAAPKPASEPAEEPAPEPDETAPELDEDEPPLEPPQAPEPSIAAPLEARPEPAMRRGLPVLAILLVLLLMAAAGVYYAWQECWIPQFESTACSEQSGAFEIAPTAPEPAETTTPPVESDRAPGNGSTQVRTCKGLEPDACIVAAESAAAAADLELARQLFQQGARMGSTKAMLRVGEMYDPDTWSIEASPEPEPDWETAAFWYESAARLGARDGLIRAGRVLCRHAGNDLEVRRGRDFLEQAIAQGAAGETPTLLATCESQQP